jgi:hypothetical protein
MLCVSYRFFLWEKLLLFKKGWWIVITTALMMFSAHFMHAWADAANYTSITKSSRYYPLYFPTTDKTLMIKLGIVDEKESRNSLLLSENKEKKDLNYPQHPIVGDSTCKTNIIFILLDSWYYKILDSTIMPNIFNFSRQCYVYTNHYSGSNGTRTGVFSIFYSIPGFY